MPASIDQIRAWIVSRVSKELGLAEDGFDQSQTFDAYGLDSLNATVIAGDLEDWLGIRLSGSLLYDCPTVETLAAYCAGVQAGGASPGPASDGDGAAEADGAGRASGLLGVVTGGERLGFAERVARFAAFRAGLPPESYLRVLDGGPDREVAVFDPATGERRTMVMFGSNNYLGLATDPRVVEKARAALARFGTGMAGPAVLNGYTSLHRALEERLSAFKHAEDTVLFPTGYAANLGVLSAMPVRGDQILLDEYVHASIVDAVRLGEGRPSTFRHNDVAGLEALLAEGAGRGGDRFVVVEGVYSMDGDCAPLDRIVPACERAGAILVLDDAHATGVLGEGGRGAASRFGVEGRVPVTVGTFSKAFGAVGGFVSGARPIIDYLRFLSRSYTFSATLPPVVVAGVLAALEVLEEEPWRLERLRDNVRYATTALAAIGVEVAPEAAVLPLPAPPGMDIRDAARRFHAAGVFINPVEYPAVARDQERLRAGVMCTHTREDLDRLVAITSEVWGPYRKG